MVRQVIRWEAHGKLYETEREALLAEHEDAVRSAVSEFMAGLWLNNHPARIDGLEAILVTTLMDGRLHELTRKMDHILALPATEEDHR